MSWMKELLNEARTAAARETAERPPMPTAIFDFEDVAEAIRVVEDGIARRAELAREKGEQRILDAAKDLTTSFLEARPFSIMAAELWQTGVVLPVILRRSLLVAILSHVEFVLKRWCVGLRGHWQLGRAPKKPSNENASHYYLRYLAEEARLQIGDFETWKEWETFEAYWAARNAIVHDAGSIAVPSEAANAVDKLQFVKIDKSRLLLPGEGIVHVLPGACEEAASIAENLLERIGRAYLAAEAARP